MIYNIQALRALAATMVIFVHLDVLLGVVGIRPFGWEGVDLFFVISGFIMVNTTVKSPQTPIAFMKNRIVRIVPVYWLATLAVFAVAVAFPNLLKSTTANIAELFKSLFFIPFLKESGEVEPVLFVGWTLNYEMFFYFVFSASLAFKNYREGLLAALGVISVTALYGVLFHPADLMAKFYTNPIILEFALGMILGLVSNRIPSEAPEAVKWTTGVVLLGALSILFVHSPMLERTPRIINSGLPAMLIVGCAVALERWNVRITSPFVIALGNASYVIYLSHPFVTQPMQMIAMRFHPSAGLAMTFIVMTLGLIFLVGLLLHLWVEKPVVNWTRATFSKPQALAATSNP